MKLSLMVLGIAVALLPPVDPVPPLFEAKVITGPFTIEFPVPGLTRAHQGEVGGPIAEALGPACGGVACLPGTMKFFFGGYSAKDLLRLSKVTAILEKASLKVQPSSWLLHEQEIGLYLSAERGLGNTQLKQVLEGVEGADVRMLGVLLDGSHFCAAVAIDTKLDFRAYEQGLKAEGVKILDLSWGHWRWGWGMKGAQTSHTHGVRATLSEGK